MLLVFSRRKRCPSQGGGASVAHHRLPEKAPEKIAPARPPPGAAPSLHAQALEHAELLRRLGLAEPMRLAADQPAGAPTSRPRAPLCPAPPRTSAKSKPLSKSQAPEPGRTARGHDRVLDAQLGIVVNLDELLRPRRGVREAQLHDLHTGAESLVGGSAGAGPWSRSSGLRSGRGAALPRRLVCTRSRGGCM